MQSSKDLVKNFQHPGAAPRTPGKFDRIAHGHPSIQRPARLDLMSHDLTQLTAQVGSRSYSLCDISAKGFSYAQHIPLKARASLPMEVERVKASGGNLHGKVLPISFYFRGESEGEVLRVHGRVCNHRLFFGLSLEDVSKELKQFLFLHRIPKDDPLHRYAKAEALLDKARRLAYSKNWSMPSLLALNISLINFFEELGATQADFDRLWQGYERRPLYIKFGIAIDDPNEARQLARFTKLHEHYRSLEPSFSDVTATEEVDALEESVTLAVREKKLKPSEIALSQARQASKALFLELLEERFTASDLLQHAWGLGLAYFKLDPSLRLPLPFLEPLSSDLRMEMAEKPLQEIFDQDFRRAEVVCHQFLFETFLGLGNLDIEEEDLNKRVFQFMQRAMEEKLKEVGWPG